MCRGIRELRTVVETDFFRLGKRRPTQQNCACFERATWMSDEIAKNEKASPPVQRGDTVKFS